MWTERITGGRFDLEDYFIQPLNKQNASLTEQTTSAGAGEVFLSGKPEPTNTKRKEKILTICEIL